mgnify:CR=1 FL=1
MPKLISKNLSEKKNSQNTTNKKPKRKGNYILEETIGEGAFAKVKLGKHIYTGEKVAIKILNKNKLFQDSNEEENGNNNDNILNDIKKIRKEINILKRLKHRNVVQLYEIMESKTNLYIIMEYCEGKDLFDYIVKKRFLSEKEACIFFQQIIDGVEYLHLSKITHRDLKPENLLLDKNNRICISDFGLSTMSDKIDSLLETPCGTPSYAPPEMLRGEKYDGCKSDIWSCGIILYSMLVGNLPFAESKEDLIYKNIMKHNYYYPQHLSNEAIDLIENMLNIYPDERYSFSQIKNHKWFNIIKPKLRPGIIFGIHKIPIDEKILEKVEQFGYDKKKCYESIMNNCYDTNSSIYFLLLKQNIEKKNSSIGDLFSDEYLKFIKDTNNWICPEKINDPIYNNYEAYSNKKNSNSNYYITIRVNAINNINKNKDDDFEAIPEEYNKESESLNDSILNLNINKDNKNKVFNNNKKNNLYIVENEEIEREKQRIELLLKNNKNNKKNENKERIINRIKTDIQKRKKINSNYKKEKNNEIKNKIIHKKIFSAIIRDIKNENINKNIKLVTENNYNHDIKKVKTITIKTDNYINNTKKKKEKKLLKNNIVKTTPTKQLKLPLSHKKIFDNNNNKNNSNKNDVKNDIMKYENKTIENNSNTNRNILNTSGNSINKLEKNKNNNSLSLNSTATEKKIKNQKVSKSSDKKYSFKSNNKDILNKKDLTSIQASPKKIHKLKHRVITDFKSKNIKKNFSDNLNKVSESQTKILSNINNNKKIYNSDNFLLSSENVDESFRKTISSSYKKKRREINLYNKHNINKKNIKNKNKISDENNNEIYIEIMENDKKKELLERLIKDEIKFQNDINIIDNISLNSNLSFNQKPQDNNYNIINHFAQKILKGSIFGKYLINKNPNENELISKEGKEIEKNFYKLQKYKNIIGIIEHIKNKKFSKKLIDFNFNSFEEYLDDEDDKIFAPSLLNIKGIDPFINKNKLSLEKREKIINILRTKSYEQKNDKIVKGINDNQIKFPTSTNSFYYGKKDIKNLGYQNPKNNIRNSKNKNKTNNELKSKSNNKSKNPISKKNSRNKKKPKMMYNIATNKRVETDINRGTKSPRNNKINKIKDVSLREESSSNYNSNNTSIEEGKTNEKDLNEKKEENKNHVFNGLTDNNNSNEKFLFNNIEKNFFLENKSKIIKDLIIETDLKKYEINDIYSNKHGEIVITPHLGIKPTPLLQKNVINSNNNINNIQQNKPEIVNSDSDLFNLDTFYHYKNNRINNYVNDDVDNSNIEMNSNSIFNISLKPKAINKNMPLCNTYTEGFYNSENKKKPTMSVFNKSINNSKINEIEKNKDKNIDKKCNIFLNTNSNTTNISKNSYQKLNSNTNLKNNVLVTNSFKTQSNDKNRNKNKNLPFNSFYNTFYSNDHDEDVLTSKEKFETENNVMPTKDINYNTMNFFYKKKNVNSIKELKYIDEFTPIDLFCLFNNDQENIFYKMKFYLKKKGFLCLDKDNGIRTIKGNTVIEIKLYKITKNDNNNVYFSIKIKSNDLKKDKETMRKMIKYIFKKN